MLGPTALTGDALSGASAGLDQSGVTWLVRPTFRGGEDGIDKFNAAAAQCFAAAPTCPTTQLAIVLDDDVISAPQIQTDSFERDQIQISGDFDESSAKDLALVLEYGALPVELVPQQTQTVSATLGEDSLRAGLVAGIIGLGLTVIFMVGYYRLLGVVAVVSLTLEFALVWVLISYLGESRGLALTLAGVTGLIVSIGISVDSNVVFYEHLKEDVRNGRTFRSTVDRSFGSTLHHDHQGRPGLADRGLPPVLPLGRAGPGLRPPARHLDGRGPDRHLVLHPARGPDPGSQPEVSEQLRRAWHAQRRGGIMTDDMGTPEDAAVEPERSGLRANLRALYQCTNDFDFTRLFKRGLVIAVLVSVISIISLFTRGLNLGIDFKGGSVWEVPVTDVSVEDARDVMEGVGLGDAKIQLAVNADGTKILRVQADVTEVDASREVTGRPGRPGGGPRLRHRREHGRTVLGRRDHPAGSARPRLLLHRHHAVHQLPAGVEDGRRAPWCRWPTTSC